MFIQWKIRFWTSAWADYKMINILARMMHSVLPQEDKLKISYNIIFFMTFLFRDFSKPHDFTSWKQIHCISAIQTNKNS